MCGENAISGRSQICPVVVGLDAVGPVRGYAAKYLATTMMVIATNDRIVENFANRTEESSFVAQKRREKRREGTWSAAYHDPQFWLDLSTEEFGSDLEE